MAREERRHTESQKTISNRERILAAAVSLLAERGEAGLSARKLATAVGASTKVIYTQFGSMREVITGVYAHYFDALTLHLKKADGGTNVQDRLLSVVRAYRTWAVENPEIFDLLYGRRAALLMPETGERMSAQRSLLVFADIFREGASFSETDSVSAAYDLWVAIHGAVNLEVSAWIVGDERFEQLAIHSIRRLLSSSPDA